jgi:hypothetical protein
MELRKCRERGGPGDGWSGNAPARRSGLQEDSPMFSTIFGHRAPDSPRIETRREAIERLLEDLNTAIDFLPEKPAVTVNPRSGHISLHMPAGPSDRARHLV